MSIDIVTSFIAKFPSDPASAWDLAKVTEMAGLSIPPTFMGDQEPLLRGDQHRLWLRWFLEGLVSPHRVAHDLSLGRLDIFESAYRRTKDLYPSVDPDRRKKLADKVTDHIFSMAEQLRQNNLRDSASPATRHALIATSPTPRCYICGYAFSKEALDAFVRAKGRDPIRLPPLVDVLRPRGLNERDEKIEIEHVVPVAGGGSGQDNLRLACGWCNKYKSDRVSIYEAPFTAPRTSRYVLGAHTLHEVPSPFWTIRILALRRRCHHVGGCDRSSADSELYVSLVDWGGSPNPTNLTVFCDKHDPVAVDRKQSRESVEKLWRERRR